MKARNRLRTEEERIVATYSYDGTPVYSIKRDGEEDYVVVPLLTNGQVLDLAENMEPYERIHMRTCAYAVFRLLRYYRMNPNDFISDDDINICVANSGCRSLTQLYRRDNRLWRVVKKRGLEKKIFETVMGEENVCLDLDEDFLDEVEEGGGEVEYDFGEEDVVCMDENPKPRFRLGRRL